MNSETEVLDCEVNYQLRKIIETLTHSGLKKLDEDVFKEVKKKCRGSPACTQKVYFLILYQLKKNHSEIRLLAFQMCIELFKRSALFRELVIKDLQLIFELTAETDPKKKLPPPKTVAESLQKLAIKTIKSWAEEFGEVYKELKIAFHYFKHAKKVDIHLLNVANESDTQRQKHLQSVYEQKRKKLMEEMNSNELDIESTVTTLTNCISLLIPTPDEFFINEAHISSCDTSRNFKALEEPRGGAATADELNEINLKHFGITANYTIAVDLNSVKNNKALKKTDENSSVIQNAEDCIKLLKNKFLPLIKNWNQSCAKYFTNDTFTIQKILGLKKKVEDSIKKYQELGINDCCDNETDSSDNDFEEVNKEHYESTAEDLDDTDFQIAGVSSIKNSETGWKISMGEEGDPTCAMSTLKKLKQTVEINKEAESLASQTSAEPSTFGPMEYKSRKKKLLESAPKIPFDIDLYHWEDMDLKAPTLLSIKLDNPKFWGTTTVDDMDEIPNPEGVAAITTRVIEFSGKFEPVKWTCRAPLPSGKQCPRRDRFKCPFHGKIVPRDEKGKVQGEDECKASASGGAEEKCEWQDPELLEDIKKATGMDLGMPKKKLKRKVKDKKFIVNKTHKTMKTDSSTLKEIERRNYPGLTDIIGKQNNVQKRISKKIFNRGSLKRVCASLNKSDFLKHRDKFGDQFNYMCET